MATVRAHVIAEGRALLLLRARDCGVCCGRVDEPFPEAVDGRCGEGGYVCFVEAPVEPDYLMEVVS